MKTQGNKFEHVTLTTERLRLRPITSDDGGAIISLINNLEVTRWLTRVPHPYTHDDLRHFLEAIAPNEAVWRICRRTEDDTPMGVIGLTPSESGAFAELGYWLGQPYWGQGYMSEAAAAVVNHAFEDLKLSFLISGYFAGNQGSSRILRKIGFIKTGQSQKPCMALSTNVEHIDMMLDAEAYRK